jgi:hypothetical protein
MAFPTTYERLQFSLRSENPFNADVPNEAIYHEHIARLRELLRG